MELLVKHQLFASKKKCSFGQNSVEYLGHVISAEGVSTDPAKTAAISKWPAPKSVKELRSFFGSYGLLQELCEGLWSCCKAIN